MLPHWLSFRRCNSCSRVASFWVSDFSAHVLLRHFTLVSLCVKYSKFAIRMGSCPLCIWIMELIFCIGQTISQSLLSYYPCTYIKQYYIVKDLTSLYSRQCLCPYSLMNTVFVHAEDYTVIIAFPLLPTRKNSTAWEHWCNTDEDELVRSHEWKC